MNNLQWQNFRHHQKWETWQGGMARHFVCGLGTFLMFFARKCYKWSFGRCSWCGKNTGCNGVVSKRGARCMNGVCDET